MDSQAIGATEERMNETSQDKATVLVDELFKLLPATSGIVLALIWGAADKNTPSHNNNQFRPATQVSRKPG